MTPTPSANDDAQTFQTCVANHDVMTDAQRLETIASISAEALASIDAADDDHPLAFALARVLNLADPPAEVEIDVVDPAEEEGWTTGPCESDEEAYATWCDAHPSRAAASVATEESEAATPEEATPAAERVAEAAAGDDDDEATPEAPPTVKKAAPRDASLVLRDLSVGCGGRPGRRSARLRFSSEASGRKSSVGSASGRKASVDKENAANRKASVDKENAANRKSSEAPAAPRKSSEGKTSAAPREGEASGDASADASAKASGKAPSRKSLAPKLGESSDDDEDDARLAAATMRARRRRRTVDARFLERSSSSPVEVPEARRAFPVEDAPAEPAEPVEAVAPAPAEAVVDAAAAARVDAAVEGAAALAGAPGAPGVGFCAVAVAVLAADAADAAGVAAWVGAVGAAEATQRAFCGGAPAARLAWAEHDFSAVAPPTDGGAGSEAETAALCDAVLGLVTARDALARGAPEAAAALADALDALRGDAGAVAAAAARAGRRGAAAAAAARFHADELRCALRGEAGGLGRRAHELASSLVRFHLRRLLNPRPLPISTEASLERAARLRALAGGASPALPDETLSAVPDIVVLAGPDGDAFAYGAATTGDASLAALASHALDHLDAADGAADDDDGEPAPADAYAAAARAVDRGLAPLRRTLEAASARRFLAALLADGAIGAAVDDAGGWICVERAADVFAATAHGEAAPERRYASLRDVAALRARLAAAGPASDAARARARSALEAYAKATPDAVKELVGHAKGRLPRPKTLLARLRDGAADALAADHLYPALTTLLP